MQNPIVSTLWNFGSSAADKGARLISTVGSKLQEKLDEAGVTQRVSSVVNTAADRTTQFGA